MSEPLDIDRWQRALVYGFGTSGRAAARLLLTRGVEVVVVDRREPEKLDLGELESESRVQWLLGNEPTAVPAGVDGVVLSPGVPGDRPLLSDARRRGLPVIAEVELAFAYARGPVIAITGSNGKSTTTAMTGAILAAEKVPVSVCGNIGVPMSESVARAAQSTFVVELSSFQLEATVNFHPRAAALLNVALDHLDRYAGLAPYLEAKRRIFLRQEPGDVAVLNADDPLVAASESAARRRFFSLESMPADGCGLAGDEVVERSPGGAERLLFKASEVGVSGRHNLENAMAAALLALAAGARPESSREGLARFRGLPHRLERVAEIDGVAWYDDSKGTNPAATLKSLSGFRPGSVHLILGGRNKGLSFAELASAVARQARRVYLIGEASAELEGELAGRVELEHAHTMANAVASAARKARAGEVVLLSPACASFDQYRDFNQRGEHFKRLVRDLAGALNG
ncbi:MAG TPA: UDP-N-acetylmuramoyl-L-alanine--D-glutamate ligase [Thermoanaerobaculia bacterium]|nr:UDP-N-acetylmuramoyl-L-alanine--D-glutamate ligase [Thermoanaerobaculia bacterium]